jgi:gustatory receptor
MLNMNSALWYINSRGIKVASESLSRCFQKVFKLLLFFWTLSQTLIFQDIEIECNANTISKYRFLWLNLSELLQSLGNAYARTYSTYCLFMYSSISFLLIE